jgi:hypothetical protein
VRGENRTAPGKPQTDLATGHSVSAAMSSSAIAERMAALLEAAIKARAAQ